MDWIIRIIFLLMGVIGTALFYRRNRQKMDKIVDAGKKVVKTETRKIAGKIKEKIRK